MLAGLWFVIDFMWCVGSIGAHFALCLTNAFDPAIVQAWMQGNFHKLEKSVNLARPPAQPTGFRVKPVMREIYCFNGRGIGPATDPYLIECAEGIVLMLTQSFGPIKLVTGYCRAAVIDRWSVRCISPFRQASDLGCNRSWAEPVNSERTIHHTVRLHVAKEEPWMRWIS